MRGVGERAGADRFKDIETRLEIIPLAVPAESIEFRKHLNDGFFDSAVEPASSAAQSHSEDALFGGLGFWWRVFDSFRDEYNQERPHEALGQEPPVRYYNSSARSYTSRVSSPGYHAGVVVRRVHSNGEIKWKGARVYLSESLRGEPVGLSEYDDRYWNIQFGSLVIGMVDDFSHRVIRTPIEVLPMSPVPGLSVTYLFGCTKEIYFQRDDIGTRFLSNRQLSVTRLQ